MDVSALALLTLACYRVAYLIAVEDGPLDLARGLRAWADRAFPPAEAEPGYYRDHWVVRGFNCPLCVSFWAAPAVLALGYALPALVWWLAVAGAVLVLHRWLEGR